MENIEQTKEIINKEDLINKIYTVRGVQVMLDSDLAQLYGYETKKFNQQVKRNIERFPKDFMFQLTMDETKKLPRSQFVTLEGKGSNVKYAPYAFTEQGVYMLATVLKSEVAIKQSITIIRTFKEMRHYLAENQYMISNQDYARLAILTSENAKEIKKIKEDMVTKEVLDEVMKEFVGSNIIDEFLFLNGERFSADVAYEQIYTLANHSIYIVDNYIGVRTLVHLKDIPSTIQIIIFSDNIGRGLSLIEFNDFKMQYPNVNISFQTTNNKYHDRYIVLDYDTVTESIYHCGASSKDAGNKITSITRVYDSSIYQGMVHELLMNHVLVLK